MWRLKQMMLDLEPSLKKKKGAAFFELDEDIDKEWIKEHQAFLVEEQRQKIKKKFEKDNEKLAAEGEKEMKASELESRLEVAKDLEKKYNKENKSGKVEAEGRGPTVEKMEAAITKIQNRVENMELQAQDKEDNKEVALGTSKIVSFPHILSSRGKSLTISRTTSTLGSQSFSARNSTSQWRNSSRSLCEKNSSGPSSPSMRTGSFKLNCIWIFWLLILLLSQLRLSTFTADCKTPMHFRAFSSHVLQFFCVYAIHVFCSPAAPQQLLAGGW